MKNEGGGNCIAVLLGNGRQYSTCKECSAFYIAALVQP